jgi:hypothetical protein
METRISEIADGIYRLSAFVPEIAPPGAVVGVVGNRGGVVSGLFNEP